MEKPRAESPRTEQLSLSSKLVTVHDLNVTLRSGRVVAIVPGRTGEGLDTCQDWPEVTWQSRDWNLGPCPALGLFLGPPVASTDPLASEAWSSWQHMEPGPDKGPEPEQATRTAQQRQGGRELCVCEKQQGQCGWTRAPTGIQWVDAGKPAGRPEGGAGGDASDGQIPGTF